ncbi:hypothetical protein SLEP1_g8985 [Rubroshorea leprosula]|uniref:Uncharacterized protein n=1 Tax=Rubroshorea leprosula TaxID=152421 RepID=A0AAV5ICN4_9ROSI|nr:hypothetical protein SLEP1_g8985 [Rubroshorea leprosula]
MVKKSPGMGPKSRGERQIEPCAETPVTKTPQKLLETSSSGTQETSIADNGVGLATSNEINAKKINNVREPFDEVEKGGRCDTSRDELQEEYEPETEYDPEEEFEPEDCDPEEEFEPEEYEPEEEFETEECEPEDDVVNYGDGNKSVQTVNLELEPEPEDGSAGEEEEIVNLSEGDDVVVVEEVEYFSDELESEEGDTVPDNEEGGEVLAEDSLCCGDKEFMYTGNQKVESDLETNNFVEEKETVMAKEIHCFRKELENKEDGMLGNDKAQVAANADGKDHHEVVDNRHGNKNLELLIEGGAYKQLQKGDVVLGCDRPAKVSLAYHHIDSRKQAKAEDGTAHHDNNSGMPKLRRAATSPLLQRSCNTKSSDSFHHKKHMKHYSRQYNLPPRKRLASDYILPRKRHCPDHLPPRERHAPDHRPPRRHAPDYLPPRRRHAPEHDYQVRKAHKEYTFRGPGNSAHLFTYHTQRNEYMEETYRPRFLSSSSTHRQAHFYAHDSNFGSKYQCTTLENIPPSCSDTPVHRPRAYLDSHQYYTSYQYRDVYRNRFQVMNDKSSSRHHPSRESHHYGFFGQDTVCAERSSEDILGRTCLPHYNDEYIYTVRDSLYPFHHCSRGSGSRGMERSGLSHY